MSGGVELSILTTNHYYDQVLTLWAIFYDHIILIVPLSSFLFIFLWFRGWNVVLYCQQI